MSPKNLVLGVALGIALAAGIWLALSVVDKPRSEPLSATVLPARSAVPEFALRDQNDAPVDEQVFKGQWDLVFFGFTNCPDVCPLTLQVLSIAKRQLAEAGQSPLPRIVLVSVDPERDTPQKMAAYIENFGDGNLGITGDLDNIRKLTGALGIFFEKRATDGDFYTVDHSAVVLLIDPEGRFHALWSSPHEISKYVHDLPILLQS